MISCDESQSDDEGSEPDLSPRLVGKKYINRGRWNKQEVLFNNINGYFNLYPQCCNVFKHQSI